ncbi:zinc-dependent alcohol dehydrogenase [Candidatus Poriferisocius sp.]|uniref:zinc-dependent alcohol dehydrogenase n=1 Tax=Candidatus Poriferisocius sp. TaxID=3101276 RepID=UPI003B0235BF
MTTSTCRAVVFNGDGTYHRRDDFAVPEPPAGGGVLKVEAVGMCGSDLAQLHGHQHVPGEKAPLVPGHEIVGRVSALAADADLGVAVGDRVAVDLIVRVPPTDTNPFGLGHLYGYTMGVDDDHGLWGGYGEYMGLLPGSHLMKLTEDTDAAELTLFEPLASVCNWFGLMPVVDGDTVVVQGPGHMGLVCAAEAKRRGAGTVIVTGTGMDGLRLEVAREVGADMTIDVTAADPVELVSGVTGGAMADMVVDLAADTVATVPLCLNLVRQGGKVLLAGLKNMAPVELVSDMIVLKGLTVQGGAGSTYDSMEESVAILNSGEFPTGPLLGEVFGLDRMDEAMAMLQRTADRDAVRVGLRHR